MPNYQDEMKLTGQEILDLLERHKNLKPGERLAPSKSEVPYGPEKPPMYGPELSPEMDLLRSIEKSKKMLNLPDMPSPSPSPSPSTLSPEESSAKIMRLMEMMNSGKLGPSPKFGSDDGMDRLSGASAFEGGAEEESPSEKLRRMIEEEKAKRPLPRP
jgi:hypothetical protein